MPLSLLMSVERIGVIVAPAVKGPMAKAKASQGPKFAGLGFARLALKELPEASGPRRMGY